MSIMRHLPQFLLDDPLSNQYSFSLSRQLEGTLDQGPGLGVWAVTDMRVQFGWGVPNRSAVGDLDLVRRWPPVIPPGVEEAGRKNRICTYRKIKSAAECAQFTKRLAIVNAGMSISQPPGHLAPQTGVPLGVDLRRAHLRVPQCRAGVFQGELLPGIGPEAVAQLVRVPPVRLPPRPHLVALGGGQPAPPPRPRLARPLAEPLGGRERPVARAVDRGPVRLHVVPLGGLTLRCLHALRPVPLHVTRVLRRLPGRGPAARCSSTARRGLKR
jgi:hypothetical protein